MATEASESPNWTFVLDDLTDIPGDHVRLNCLVDVERDANGYLLDGSVKIGRHAVRDRAVVEQLANLALDILEVTESLPGAAGRIAIIPAPRKPNPAVDGIQLTIEDIPLEPPYEEPHTQVA